MLHRDLLFACACLGDGIEVTAKLRQRLVKSMLELYFDRLGKGKYQKLREDIEDILKSYAGITAALDVEEISLTALKDESQDVRSSAAEAFGKFSLIRNEMTANLDWEKIAEALRAAIDASAGKPSLFLSFKEASDVIFEALMQVVERLEEKRD